jgi:hypothetical protein
MRVEHTSTTYSAHLVLYRADGAYILVEHYLGGGKTIFEMHIDVATCSESRSWIDRSAPIGRLKWSTSTPIFDRKEKSSGTLAKCFTAEDLS